MLSEVAEVVLVEGKRLSGGDYLPYVGDVDAIVAGTGLVTREVFEHAPKLKIVARDGVGYDNVDVAAASEHGVWVTIAPADELFSTVADHAMALMLCVARKVCVADRSLRSGSWDVLMGAVLEGKTLGILGLGRIGYKIAMRGKGFNMKIIYYDAVRKEDVEGELGIEFRSFDKLLEESDYLVISVPLTAQTKGMVSERELRKMKKSAYLINIARGPIVDHQALVKALREGWIAGAGLDVFYEEPLPPDDPILTLDNVVLTPHIAGQSEESLEARSKVIAEEILRVFRGEEPKYAVNRVVRDKARHGKSY